MDIADRSDDAKAQPAHLLATAPRAGHAGLLRGHVSHRRPAGQAPRRPRMGHACRQAAAREVEDLLDALAGSGASARTINKRRALLGAVFTYGVKRAGLPTNPVRATDKRREPQRAALDTYSVAEVERLASALAEGRHRD